MILSCPSCEQDLRPHARFCDWCGASLAPEPDDELALVATRLLSRDDDPPPRPTKEIDNPATINFNFEASDSSDHGPAGRSHTAKQIEPGTIPLGPIPDLPATDERKPPLDRGLRVGSVLHQRYQVKRRLGTGGFGAVYLAQDIKLNRRCVIKQMMTSYRSSQTLKILRANFEREARLLVQLNEPGHPNIPEIYDHFFEDDGNYLVMKYISGRDLKKALEQSGGALPVEETTRYAVDLCSALHYMHTYGEEPVIHRDIKPGNILLGDDGRIWLVDFGLAKAQPVEVSGEKLATKAYGSFGYSPLEQWFGEPTPASDIYALGATLHHLLSGVNPVDAFNGSFTVLTVQQRHAQFVPLRRINDDIPDVVEGIVASATAADPEQRPTALQLQQQLNIFIEGGQGAPLFTFKSGEAATTRGRLVDLCDRYRREARGYLYRGDFERWFRLLNRHDLAEAATQAVKRGKNRADGLEKFLKLIFPNLFLRRTARAARRIAALFLQFGLMALVVLFLTAFAGSWLIGAFLERAIGDYEVWQEYVPWQDRYTESDLNNIAQAGTGPLFDEIFVDVQPPDRVIIHLNWNGLILSLTLAQDPQGRPYHFQLVELNGLSLGFVPFIPDNIGRGLNAGLDVALCQARLEINDLVLKTEPIDQTYVIDTLYLDRKPVDCSTSSTVSPIATPSPAAAREESADVDVFNRSNHRVLVEFRGPVSPRLIVGPNETERIEASPGAYVYEISRIGDEQNAVARGQLILTSYYRLEIVE